MPCRRALVRGILANLFLSLHRAISDTIMSVRRMLSDPDLDLRGRLIRSLGALREMLPGSFVERRRSCGRPNCHCADGKNLHSQFQISLLVDGKPKTFNIPAKLAEEVRQKIEMHHRLDAAVATICSINLRRFLKQKEDQ